MWYSYCKNIKFCLFIFLSFFGCSNNPHSRSTTAISLPNLPLVGNVGGSTKHRGNNSTVAVTALASLMEIPGGAGIASIVKEIFHRIGVNIPAEQEQQQNDEIQGTEILKDIWTTISHYVARQDLNSLERLEDIGLEILSGFSEREKDTVYFYLYNRHRNGSDLIKYGSLDQLRRSTFVVGKPVKFLIHGFKMNGFSHFNYLLKEAYLKHGGDINVFNVDWRRLAGEYVYFNAAFNTRIVGERLGELVIFLKRNGFIQSYDQIHLVGFSLGAHVAGYTGKYVMKVERQQIGRISGLDPAGPSFAGLTSISRLDKGDAKFVDVIHTSSGRSGIVESIGHVDFFPNGGADQPGCDWEKISDYFLRNCSHERAFYLYLETIRGKKFLGCPCTSWEDFELGKCYCHVDTEGAELMGEYCNSTARGNRYLHIKEVYPIISSP